MAFMQSSLKMVDRILIFTIIVFPFLLIWQGGDLSDTGYHAVYKQYFFNNLDAGNIHYTTILSDFIGNLWLNLFPGLGVWGLYLLAVLFFQGGVFLAFLTLNEMKPRYIVLVGLLCGQVFALRYSSMTFSFDFASFFFLMLTAYCMWQGISKISHAWIFIAGLATGLAFLARLPDIIILCFVPLVFLHFEWMNQKNLFTKAVVWEAAKKYTLYLLGFISLCFLFGLIIRATDTWDTYFQNLFGLTNKLTGADWTEGYSLKILLNKYLSNLERFLPYMFSILMTVIVFCAVLQAAKNSVVLYILVFVCVGCAFLIFYGKFSYTSTFKYFVPALCILSTVFAFIPHESNTKQHGSLLLIAWMTAFVSFAGSDTGLFLKLCWGMPLLVPLIGVLMWNRNVEKIWKLHITWRPLLLTSAIIIILVGGIIRFGWIYHLDSGLLSRFRAVYPINHELMRNIYTTSERAKYIEEVTSAIERYIHPENSLFIYGHEPLFYYLSQRKPAIFRFWMGVGPRRAEQIFQQLDRVISQTSKYPLILITDKERLGVEGSELLEKFLEKHYYQCVEKSQNFQIWNIKVK